MNNKAQFTVTGKFAAHKAKISSLMLLGVTTTQLVSAGYDGIIAVWDLPTFRLQTKIFLNQIVLCLKPQTSAGFFCGLANGQLVSFDANFQEQARAKLHDDCLTDIIVHKEEVITVGHDGAIVYSNFAMTSSRKLQTEYPISKIYLFKNNLYLASFETKILGLNSKQWKTLKGNFQAFQQVQGYMYGISGSKGIVNLQTKGSGRIPVDLLFSFKNRLFGMTGNNLYMVEDPKYISFVCFPLRNTSWNFEVSCALEWKNSVILGSRDGSISFLTACTQKSSHCP